jgi:hypothetical protein
MPGSCISISFLPGEWVQIPSEYWEFNKEGGSPKGPGILGFEVWSLIFKGGGEEQPKDCLRSVTLIQVNCFSLLCPVYMDYKRRTSGKRYGIKCGYLIGNKLQNIRIGAPLWTYPELGGNTMRTVCNTFKENKDLQSKRSGPLGCMLPDIIGCSEFSILGHFLNHFGPRHVVGVWIVRSM